MAKPPNENTSASSIGIPATPVRSMDGKECGILTEQDGEHLGIYLGYSSTDGEWRPATRKGNEAQWFQAFCQPAFRLTPIHSTQAFDRIHT